MKDTDLKIHVSADKEGTTHSIELSCKRNTMQCLSHPRVQIVRRVSRIDTSFAYSNQSKRFAQCEYINCAIY